MPTDLFIPADVTDDRRLGRHTQAVAFVLNSLIRGGYITRTAAADFALDVGGPFQPLDAQLTDLAALAYTANALKVVRVNAGATAFELADLGALYQPLDTQLTSLAGLAYTTNAAKVIAVNAAETGFELVAQSGAPAAAADPITSEYPAFTAAGIDDEFDDASFTGWTAVNSGLHNPTITELNDVLALVLPGSDAAAELHAYVKAPAAIAANDYVEIGFRGMGRPQNYNICGVLMADGNTYGAGNQVCWYYSVNEASPWYRISFTNYNTAGAFANFARQTVAPTSDMYLRLKYEGSNNWSGWVSCDGVGWLNVTGTFARTLTPTHLGFFVTTWGGTLPFAWSIRYCRKGS